jgi:hypothetical protein
VKFTALENDSHFHQNYNVTAWGPGNVFSGMQSRGNPME